MKSLPSDPFAMQARVVSALCDDLFDIGAGRSDRFARTDALREISQQQRGAGSPNKQPATHS